MRELKYDAIVVGAGAAGISSSSNMAAGNAKVALLERDDFLGGVLPQCIHNGFGLNHFKQDLTGPEFVELLAENPSFNQVDKYLGCTALDLKREDGSLTLIACSAEHGLLRLTAKVVILATGCRERNRGNLGIPGTRPAGVFTAGLAQRLINIDGYLPGKRVVVVGSGDIGLIMARRLTWMGSEVLGVVEIMPYPSGLIRNIAQCLNDYDIPLHLNHYVSKIIGANRVEGVEITPFNSGVPEPDKTFSLDCDSILLSVGLVPENELAKKAGVSLSHETGGAYVDTRLMTDVPGVFACGNALHVHDLVDFVSDEAERCAEFALDYLAGGSSPESQGNVIPGANVKYVVPNKYQPEHDNLFSFRSMIVKEKVELEFKLGDQVVKKKKLRRVSPSEMIKVTLEASLLSLDEKGEPQTLEISLT